MRRRHFMADVGMSRSVAAGLAGSTSSNGVVSAVSSNDAPREFGASLRGRVRDPEASANIAREARIVTLRGSTSDGSAVRVAGLDRDDCARSSSGMLCARRGLGMTASRVVQAFRQLARAHVRTSPYESVTPLRRGTSCTSCPSHTGTARCGRPCRSRRSSPAARPGGGPPSRHRTPRSRPRSA